MATNVDNETPGSLTCLGKIVILVFILASAGGAYYFLMQKGGGGAQGTGTSTGTGTTAVPVTPGGAPVEIGIAYGTEKKEWLKWSVDQFAQAPEGKNIKVNLLPFGSLEGAQAIVKGNEKINVWSPASAMYKDTFVQNWQLNHNDSPIYKEDALALTPMVFVMWEERYQEFVKKYKVLTFKTIADALQEKGGWETIAQKPDWGQFKFGHTHPNESNSGLATLLLMAHEYQGKAKRLEVRDITNAQFQTWMQTLERGVTGLSNSTGTMMRDMILKGPSSYDAVFVYENIAIENLKNAQGRWGSLRVIYPEYNIWNDHPYYILNAPWNTPEKRAAAEVFLQFLQKEEIQREALVHGFRPGNLTVSIKSPDSPFTLGQKYGITVDLTTVVDPPKADVIENLLTSWQRSQAGR